MRQNQPVVVDGADGEKKVSRTFWRGENTQFRPSAIAMREPDAMSKYVLKGLMPDQPFIDKDTTIVAFGSCFAQHISGYLNTIGFNVASREGKAYVSAMGDGIVNTFAIRQQFEWAWEGRVPEVSLWHGYKAEEFGYDDEVRTATKELFDKANVFIITLGLSEVWYDEPTGEVFWRAVPAAQFDPSRHKFRVTTQAENKANINVIRDLIRKHRPDANIVFTLSPVPLAASFRPIGPLPADSVSKASLRSAIDEVMNEHTDDKKLHYFPSYEVVRECFHYPYAEDLRHPRPHVLSLNMLAFERYFCMTNRSDADLDAAYLSAIKIDEKTGSKSAEERDDIRRKMLEQRSSRPAVRKTTRAPLAGRATAAAEAQEAGHAQPATDRDARIAERDARIAAREQRIKLREERSARIAAREERLKANEERSAREKATT